jgi:hypothetical protein
LLELAGDEGVEPGGGERVECAHAAAGENGDLARVLGAELERGHAARETLLQAGAELGPVGGRGGDQTDADSLVWEESAEWRQTESAGEQGVVAELGMCIERKVGGVDGEVGCEGDVETLALGADEGAGAIPEHTVMDKEEIETAAAAAMKVCRPASTAAPMRVTRPLFSSWRPLYAPGKSGKAGSPRLGGSGRQDRRERRAWRVDSAGQRGVASVRPGLRWGIGTGNRGGSAIESRDGTNFVKRRLTVPEVSGVVGGFL